MLELTQFDSGLQVFLDPEGIESIEQQEDCCVVVMSSGQMHAVKEAASEVYRERESLLYTEENPFV